MELETLSGGMAQASAETNWKRIVRERSDIEELASDIEVGTHNMWVDIRSKDFGTTEYEPVEIDVIVQVSERDD